MVIDEPIWRAGMEIQMLWYIYTMEYYLAIQKNESESVLVRWMNLEPVIQSEVSQRKTNTVYYCICRESRKTVLLMNLLGGKGWSCRCREGHCGHSGRRSQWDEWTKQHQPIYTIRCKMDRC